MHSLLLVASLVLSGGTTLGQGLEHASSRLPGRDTVYAYVNEMPTFPGGDAALRSFLTQHIQFPTAALHRRVSGTVYVAFVVDREGRTTDVRVVKGLGFGLDEEALRLVRIMPWWKPGKEQGELVRVACTLPIMFQVIK